MLSISSASSSTTFCTLSSLAAPRCMRSMSRPGVATIICAPRLSACIWSMMDVPPYTATMLMPLMYFANDLRSSAICRHSSRVGEITIACVFRSVGSVRCRSGMPKAAVLPVPVWARAMTSLPLPSRYGITSSCTGMGCSKPSSSMARRISGATPNSSNVCMMVGIGGWRCVLRCLLGFLKKMNGFQNGS